MDEALTMQSSSMWTKSPIVTGKNATELCVRKKREEEMSERERSGRLQSGETNPWYRLWAGRMTTFLPITEYLPTFTAPRSPRIIAPGITAVCKTSSQLVEIQDCQSLLEHCAVPFRAVECFGCRTRLICGQPCCLCASQ
jgi:hypothetical protein